jgi:FkbM family methyltransferase
VAFPRVSATAVSLMNRVPGGLAARIQSDSLPARVLARALNRVLPMNTLDVVVRSGSGAGLHLPIDPQCEKFYWTGAYELPVQRTLQRLLAPGVSFWDVGAHIGYFTLIASRLVSPSGCVEAFEPHPQNRNRLRSAVARNGALNVSIHPVALGARSGPAKLVLRGSSLTGAITFDTGEPGVPVDCSTLDDEAKRLSPPDLVKIDAEGLEVDVLRGGLRILNERRPTLVVEFSTAVRLEEARALLPLYAFRPLDETHWLLEALR